MAEIRSDACPDPPNFNQTNIDAALFTYQDTAAGCDTPAPGVGSFKMIQRSRSDGGSRQTPPNLKLMKCVQ